VVPAAVQGVGGARDKTPIFEIFYGGVYGPLVDMGRCSDLILCDARRVRYLEEKGDLTGGEIDLFQHPVKVDSMQPVDDRDGYSKRRIRWQRHALVVFGLVHDDPGSLEMNFPGDKSVAYATGLTHHGRRRGLLSRWVKRVAVR